MPVEINLKPAYDYGEPTFDMVAEDIWDARDKMNLKTIEKNPVDVDKKSNKSKKKRKTIKDGGQLSAGRKSINDSQVELSGGFVTVDQTQTLILNQTISDKFTVGGGRAAKAKSRDFKVGNSRVLSMIGAENYDRMPDLSELKVEIEGKI